VDFNEARSKYTQLKQQFDQGKIDAQEFERQANDLTVKAPNGDSWQIGVKTGRWYRFDGQQWVEGIPPRGTPEVMASGPIPLMAPPPPAQYIPPEQPRRRFSMPCIVGAIVALVLVVCVALVGGFFIFGQGTTTPLAPVNNVPTAGAQMPASTPQASVPSTASGPVAGPGFDASSVFTDDFSDPSSGWNRASATNGSTDYSSGQYRILVNQSSYVLWAIAKRNFPGDVTINVDATKAGGPDDNAFGVICRYSDSNNFYRFLISSDGYAAIGRKVGGSSAFISSEKMMPASAILKGVATNHISATCIGNALTLSVNGTQIAQATDDSLKGGDVGLIAQTFDAAGAEILFDNFLASAR
jgi:hypothetical protein